MSCLVNNIFSTAEIPDAEQPQNKNTTQKEPEEKEKEVKGKTKNLAKATRKRSNITRLEEAMANSTKVFLDLQRQQMEKEDEKEIKRQREEREWEEKRRREEREWEEKRRHEEREHEMRMMSIFMRYMAPQTPPVNPGPYEPIRHNVPDTMHNAGTLHTSAAFVQRTPVATSVPSNISQGNTDPHSEVNFYQTANAASDQNDYAASYTQL